MNDRERIGARIREIRRKRGMTQGQLAESCGMIQTTISKIEAGKFNASIDLMSRIATALGATLDLTEG